LHEAFAPRLEVESMAAEGDTVAVRYRERGRFVGPFRGHAPTGRPFELVAMAGARAIPRPSRARWVCR
jgi:hypothetical protein